MQTEVFRGFQKSCSLSAQTAVECKFGQEVENVLLSHASATLTSIEAGNGEVRYAGKAHFIIVYEDGEKHVCRGERGVEFSAVYKDGRVLSTHTARACISVENISLRREGASVYLTALLGADISLYGEESFEYLTGGDLVCKRESVALPVAHLVGGVTEADDEFETEFVSDILLHAETARVTETACERGSVRVAGEVSFSLLALKGSNLLSFERLVPFRVEIPCDEASPSTLVEARVSVLSATVHADSDEEKGKCKVNVELTLGIEGCVTEEVVVDAVVDCYSCSNDLAVAQFEKSYEGAGELTCRAERISGRAALSSPVDFSDTLQAVSLQRAEANLVASENGCTLEGVACATLTVLGADGSHRGIEMSLPFTLPADGEGEASVYACGMSARQKQEGEIEVEGTLKIVCKTKKTCSVKLISSAVLGEEIAQSDCAVSVYLPRVGDGLWETAKALKKSPEELLRSNPDLQFPVKEGERIVVFRKKSLA